MRPAAPGVIDRYFRAVNEDETGTLVACFHDDSAVSDEGRTPLGGTVALSETEARWGLPAMGTIRSQGPVQRTRRHTGSRWRSSPWPSAGTCGEGTRGDGPGGPIFQPFGRV